MFNSIRPASASTVESFPFSAVHPEILQDPQPLSAAHTAPNGELRILIGSDNNFNDWQRTLLLEFALPE